MAMTICKSKPMLRVTTGMNRLRLHLALVERIKRLNVTQSIQTALQTFIPRTLMTVINHTAYLLLEDVHLGITDDG